MCASGKEKEEGMGEREQSMKPTATTTISAMDSVTIKEAVRRIEAALPSGLRIASIAGDVFFAGGEVYVGKGSINVTFEPETFRAEADATTKTNSHDRALGESHV